MGNAVGTILLIGGVIVVGVLFWKRCEIDFMKSLCDEKGTAQTRALSKKIQDQSDFSIPKTAEDVRKYLGGSTKIDTTPKKPGTAVFEPGDAYINGKLVKGGGKPKANYANSLYSVTPNVLRLAI
jgi:hypothetical protein